MVSEIHSDLQSIVNQISKLSECQLDELSERKEKEEQPMKKDVVLFFSFDVVNSTAYKTINYYGWAQVLNLLFKELREEVRNKIEGSEMWRVLGDEAIFIVKIRDEDELRVYINKIFEIMVSTIAKLKAGKFFQINKNFALMKVQNILSLKTSAWIAAVNDVGDIDNKEIASVDLDNIFERYQTKEGYEIFEFLGNDIDTGFRVASQTQDGRLALSFELAYLISQKTETLSYLHIITYRRLKGVWKEKLYPIIWYHDPKAFLQNYNKEVQFQDSFTFDACGESDLIKEYYDHQEQSPKDNIIRDSRMYNEPYYALNKILQDRGLSDKIERIQQLIKDSTYDRTRYLNTEFMQVHCVAVCFTIEESGEIKILVAKRQKTRRKLNGKWEFGCAKAVIDKSIAQRIKEEYKQDFGIDIEPVLDKTREMEEPIPIALYHVSHDFENDSDKEDKGIITLAQIKTDFKIHEFKATEKHEKVEWVRESDLAHISEKYQSTIPDFENSLRAAFCKIKELKNKGRI